MNLYVQKGWPVTYEQRFILCLLFIYHIGWNVMVYALVNRSISLFMYRFPSADQSDTAVQLFLADLILQLSQPAFLSQHAIYFLLLIGIRVLLAPVLHAGIYNSIASSKAQPGYRFASGVRRFSCSFAKIQLIALLVMLCPIFVIIPLVTEHIPRINIDDFPFLKLFLWVSGLLLYTCMVKISVMYIQFARVSETTVRQGLCLSLRMARSIGSIAITLFIIKFICVGIYFSIAYLNTGLFAHVIYLICLCVHIYFSVWTIASHYQLWIAKRHLV